MGNHAKLNYIIAMLIFGSIGIFVKNIDLPTSVIVLWRTIIGSLFLSAIFLIRKQKVDTKGIKENFVPLLIAGVVLGGGWVFLFEAYRHTTVSMATMLYYCAPIAVFFLSPIIFKEKFMAKQVICMLAAVVGMLIINGVGSESFFFSMGTICGLISAVLYAALMITNKFIRGLSGLESTWVQLIVAAIVMIFYVLFTTGQVFHLPTGNDLLMMIILGIVHTGIACLLYFTAMQHMTGQSISILSYIDPSSALIFAAIFLNEKLLPLQLLGALLIFGGTIFSQLVKPNPPTSIASTES